MSSVSVLSADAGSDASRGATCMDPVPGTWRQAIEEVADRVVRRATLPRALPVGIGAVRRRNPSTALRYSAATGDATLGELAEWDPEVAEPFAPGALISASGLSERRDFPSK